MHLLVVAISLAVIGPCVSQGSFQRLPTGVTPMEVTLRVNLEDSLQMNATHTSRVAQGSILIDFHVTNNKSLSSLKLNVGLNVEVDFNSIMIFNKTTTLHIGAIDIDDDNTVMTVKLVSPDRMAIGGYYMFSCKFTTTLNSEPYGLFTRFDNKTSPYIAMNLRPFAREVMPCFDEPQHKVPVTLQVVHPANYKAISTAPLVNSTSPDENNMVLDTFAPTGLISIHSLSLFVSEIEPDNTNPGMQVWAPPALLPTPVHITNLVDSIIGLLGPFPFAPLNLVVLPDFFNIAFSSAGVVFVSPEVFMGSLPLQFNDELSSLKLSEAFLRQHVEYTRTPMWWSDIWLSESIGTYLAIHLKQDPWWVEATKVIFRSAALGEDFSNNTAPLVNNGLMSKYDIENVLYNQTIRNKGVAVLAMWNDTMPEGLVMKTLLQYLQLNKTVMTTGDLFDIMEANILSDPTYNISAALSLLPQWLTAPGYPTVAYFPQSDTNFVLSQAPGCVDYNSWAVPVSPLWPVSVSYTTKTSLDWDNWGYKSKAPWLLSTNGTFSLADNTTLDGWFISNLKSGVYRVDYADQWSNVVTALRQDLTAAASVPDSIRAAVQDDAVALALGGCIPFSMAFEVLNNTARNQLDWYPFTKALEVFTNKIGVDLVYDQFAMFAASLFSPDFLSSLDMANSFNNTDLQEVRALLTPWLCRFNIGNCRQSVVALSGPLWTGNTSAIAVNDLENVACYGARYCSDSVLSSLMDAYSSTDSPWLQRLYAIGISCLSDQSSVNRTLYALMDSTSPITMTDTKVIMIGLAKDVQNVDTLMDFIVAHIQDLEPWMGVTAVANIIKTMANNRVDLSKLAPLTNPDLGLHPYLTQWIIKSMDKAAASEAWWSANRAALSDALPQTPTTAPPTAAPTEAPTSGPTTAPTSSPSPTPTTGPTTAPTTGPSPTPTTGPSGASLLTSLPITCLLLATTVSSLSLIHHF